MSDLPPFEPNADARAMAGIVRNWHVALLDAGFSSEDAMELVKSMLEQALSGNLGRD